jgi:hypothetical protein
MHGLAKYLTIVGVYVAGAAVWLYVLDGPGWGLAFLFFNAIVGCLAATWWALLLPVTLGPLAIWVPAGNGDLGASWTAAIARQRRAVGSARFGGSSRP